MSGMTAGRRALAALIYAVGAFAAAAAAGAAPSGNPVFDKTVEIVKERYYAPDQLGPFNETVAAVMARLPELGTASPDSATTRAAVNTILASLGASHTGRFTRDQRDYYELIDVFRGAVRRDMRRLFPPDGAVAYDGIGIATAGIDGRVFVTDVYDGGPAAKAGVLAGDEIVAVDGAPFEEIGSFAGKAGHSATLSLRRSAEAEPMAVAVEVARIEPGSAFVEAIRDSARVVERGNRRIGVIHLWSYTSGAVTGVIYDAIATGALKDVDGLVLDLRSRWGGAPGDAAETFLGRTAEMRLIDRDGKVEVANARFHKPVVAIIDEGTRSGMEILAYALKKNGVPLVGAPTAGDVLAGTAFLLPDDSLLELAVEDVLVDGKRLEANPVTPDIAAPYALPYANGRDPQFDAAAAELIKRLDG